MKCYSYSKFLPQLIPIQVLFRSSKGVSKDFVHIRILLLGSVIRFASRETRKSFGNLYFDLMKAQEFEHRYAKVCKLFALVMSSGEARV